MCEDILNKYSDLQENKNDLKQVIINNKWLKEIITSFNDILQSEEQNIINKITSLQTRYSKTLSQTQQEVALYENKVMEHLKEMGFEL